MTLYMTQDKYMLPSYLLICLEEYVDFVAQLMPHIQLKDRYVPN